MELREKLNIKGAIILKRLASLTMLVLLFSMSLFSPASASSYEPHSHSSENGEVDTLYIPCPESGGKHQMSPRGLANVTLGNGSNYKGYMYQCKKCNMGLAMDANINFSPKPSTPGKYVTDSIPYQVGTGYKWITNRNLSSSSSWNDTFFSSMTFVQ